MIALTGIVFSLTFVMVQFSATAYCPRLVLWISRDPVISHAIGVFTATFLYALAALAWVDRGGSGRVPLSGVLVVGLLLIVSVMMFISLIQRVGRLQVTRMLIFTGDQGREVIENLYPRSISFFPRLNRTASVSMPSDTPAPWPSASRPGREPAQGGAFVCRG